MALSNDVVGASLNSTLTSQLDANSKRQLPINHSKENPASVLISFPITYSHAVKNENGFGCWCWEQKVIVLKYTK